jgi:hypothetical protein
MTYRLGIFLTLIFGCLSLLHLYWAAGGRWGSEVTVPSTMGKRTMNPSRLATVMVAVALGLALLTILGRLGVFGAVLPAWIFYWGTLGIAGVFLLRAVGDFKLVGFFKQVRGTGFARWDTRLYSPLCLLISIIALLVAFNTP